MEEVCLVLFSPNRIQEQCLVGEKKKKKNRDYCDHCFPTKATLLLERRDGDPVLERQTGDVTKRFWEWSKEYREKGEWCSKDGKRQGEKTYMEKTRKFTEEEDANKKILRRAKMDCHLKDCWRKKRWKGRKVTKLNSKK